MVFSSLVFLFFFLPAVLILYFALPGRGARNLVLLCASLIFYAWGEPRYIALIIASVVINWALGLLIARSGRHAAWVLAAGICTNLLGIVVFKYAGFFVQSGNHLFGLANPLPRIALPIGISFYTFQAISYLVDVYRGQVTPQKNPLYFGTYLTMFSQLIAGPIVRYERIAGDLVRRSETLELFGRGFRRFIVGLGKKVIIANIMGSIADEIIAAGPSVGALGAWIAFIAYSFQIYFDFSAYSDMAIGLGLMFGFRFLENFNYPYIARSVTEFWRRWHISLGSFFRDYVYIPLGGNRVLAWRWLLNLMIVWGLTGLWHGASWNFVLWGLYYGLLLIGEKAIWGNWLTKIPRPFQHSYAMLSVLAGWPLFRIESLPEATQWWAALTGAYGAGHPATLNALNVLHKLPWLLVAAVGSTPFVTAWLRRWCVLTWADDLRSRTSGRPIGAWCVDGLLGCLLVWSVAELLLGSFNPFIYYRF